MNGSERVLAHIGKVYRLRMENGLEGTKYPLDALVNDRWKQVQYWDDPGHVASQLVRHGIAADHAAALRLLQDTNGN